MSKFLTELKIYLLGILLDGPKGLGSKGWLFVYPFVLIILIILYLIIRIFIG